MNDTSSLQLLILIPTMLMAYIRPATSVDLSKLDIKVCSLSGAGVTFKAKHISMQSGTSKPLANFFYLRYLENQTICPAVTLQAYETKTLKLRAWSTEKPCYCHPRLGGMNPHVIYNGMQALCTLSHS